MRPALLVALAGEGFSVHVSARAIIKEHVAGAFFGREESGMINAVLDGGIAREFRAEEFEAKTA